MKTILLKLRKCLCLTLSIFLLASNMQVFAQEAPGFDSFQNMKTNLESLKKSFERLEKHYTNPKEALKYYTKDFCNYATAFEKQYMEVRNEYINWCKQINTDVRAMETFSMKDLPLKEENKMIFKNLFDKDPIEIRVSGGYAESIINEMKNRKYAIYERGSMGETFGTYIADSNVEKIYEYINFYKNSIGDMSDKVEIITQIQNKTGRTIITPIEILEYAYKNDMLPKEKAGVKLTLEAMDADVSVNSLVKSIRKYLTDFGTKVKDVKYYPEESLMRELEGMTLAERTKYVDELTELQSGSKEFIKDFNKLDRPAKRYISKNITGGAWVSVGLVVGLTLLFELIPQNSNANNINKSLEIMDTLDDISYKIENGEATMAEMLYFYTIPENEYLILKDPVHTLNFVKLAQGAMEAEEILEAEKENKAKENKAIENSILKNYQKQASKTDFGVGTL